MKLKNIDDKAKILKAINGKGEMTYNIRKYSNRSLSDKNGNQKDS